MTKKTRITLLIILWALAILWTSTLFGFSGQDGEASEEMSMWVTALVLKIFPGLPIPEELLNHILRKIAHFTIFALEGMLISSALMFTLRRCKTGAIAAMPLCAVIAALNEYHQSFSAERNPALYDVGINCAGAAAGIALVVLAVRWMRRRNAIIS